MSESTNIYAAFTDTPEWLVIDRAVSELAQNHDLTEMTAHPLIVGYLCKALAERVPTKEVKLRRSAEEVNAILEAAQAAFKAANPTGRDPVAELSAERREAAARGE